MTIESRAILITTLRQLINLLSFIAVFGVWIWFIVITDTKDPKFIFIWVPLYALFSTLLDWLSSKFNARWFREVDPAIMLENQGLTIAELKTYLALVLKFRFMRIGIGGFFALIAFMFSFHPVFVFTFIYLASYIVSLCYFYVLDIKIPKDLRFEPSTDSTFSRSRRENNPFILGSAANIIRRHRRHSY